MRNSAICVFAAFACYSSISIGGTFTEQQEAENAVVYPDSKVYEILSIDYKELKEFEYGGEKYSYHLVSPGSVNFKVGPSPTRKFNESAAVETAICDFKVGHIYTISNMYYAKPNLRGLGGIRNQIKCEDLGLSEGFKKYKTVVVQQKYLSYKSSL